MRIASLTLAMTLFVLSSCGLVDGGAPTSTGDFDIVGEVGSISIQAPENSEAYKLIPISNTNKGPIQISNVLFADNLCGDFSLVNIVDSLGVVVYEPGNILQVVVAGGQNIKLTIRYAPTTGCVYKDYDATLYIYYSDGTATRFISILLKPTIGAPLPAEEEEEEEEEETECAEDPQDFEYLDQTFTGPPMAGEYFLRIDRMASFIYPTGFAGAADLVGTDIDVEPDAFTKPFLKVTVAEDGGLTIAPITPCEAFFMPSNPENANFGGVDTRLTSPRDFTATIDANGVINLPELVVTLRAEDIPESNPNVRDPVTGNFQVSVRSPLTTGDTVEDTILGNIENTGVFEEGIMNLFDEDGNGQPILRGMPLTGGKTMLVGRGQFIDEENNFIGSTQAKQFLITQVAYIYIQIEATFTQRVE